MHTYIKLNCNGVNCMEDFDVIVIGSGIAGISAAIEARDLGANVVVLERGYGGGASGLSGGVVYAGGGTSIQKEAGIEDTPENMFNYLSQETQGIVKDETLRRFCEESPGMIEWLIENGAEFKGTVCEYKTSYPTDQHYLYYSGNEKAWPYMNYATPAPRGHRQVAPGMSSGNELMRRLTATAERKGVVIHRLTRVQEWILEDNVVHGVRVKTVDLEKMDNHKKIKKYGDKFSNWYPPLGKKLNTVAENLWEKYSTVEEIRGEKIIIAAGGFVFNQHMRAQHIGPYKDISPLGTEGDDGTGILLGLQAGGYPKHLSHFTAWRFMSPTSAFLEGITVNENGNRIGGEDLYGATHSHRMITEHNARGYLILDKNMWKKAKSQMKEQTQKFQRLQLNYLFTIGHKKANTLDELAKKINVPVEQLKTSVIEYNMGILNGDGDPARKTPAYCAPIQDGPFYAIDISIKNVPVFPAPGLSLGGLVVNEETGQLLTEAGETIPNVYAAGRSAVGICSNGYISGLSLADGVFSGRRAGSHAVQSMKLNKLLEV